jgi:phosphoglycolate phosphatase
LPNRYLHGKYLPAHYGHKMNIIFDFDGTIADTFVVAIELFYAITKRTDRLADADISRLRGMTILRVAHELQVPIWKIPYLLFRARKLMERYMAEVTLIDGMADAIRTLKTQGHELYIVSSNSRSNIDFCLERYGLINCFSDIYGGIGLFSKAKTLKQLMRHKQMASAQTWYVGDEARDIEAARRVAIRCVAVSWGFNNVHVLAGQHPDQLVFTAEELVKVLNT